MDAVKETLKRLAKEDKEYLEHIKHLQKKKRLDTKRIMKERESRRHFFRRRLIKSGYEEGKFWDLKNSI